MSKTAIRVNAIICVAAMILALTRLGSGIHDFNSARTWFDLVKALFWVVLAVAAFWISMHHLVNKKPIWRAWE